MVRLDIRKMGKRDCDDDDDDDDSCSESMLSSSPLKAIMFKA